MSNRIKAKIIDMIYRALKRDGYGGILDAYICSQLEYIPDYKDIRDGEVDYQDIKPDKNNYKRGYRLELIKKGVLMDDKLV